MADMLKIIVLEGDETGQELLEQAVRVLDGDLLGVPLELERFDLSLERRRETGNEIVHEAARAMKDAGFGLKAATVTPEGRDDVGSPNRILREEVDGKVIVPHRAPHPRRGRALCRASITRSRSCAWPSRTPTAPSSGARVPRAPTTRSPIARKRSPAPPAARWPSTRSARRSGWRPRSTAGPKWTVSPVYEGMLKEEMDAAARRHPSVTYQPVLIDATYAGLLTGAADTPLVIPALNRDGDCLSDLVLPMYGSIAGAESILLSFDEDYGVRVAMAEAPHGTAPSLMGKDLREPDGHAAGLRRRAVLCRCRGLRGGRACVPSRL